MTSSLRDDKLVACRLSDLVAGVCFLLAVALGGALLAWYAITGGQDVLSAAGFYAVVAVVLVPAAALFINRWSYLVLDFGDRTYRLKPGLRAKVRSGPIDTRLRVILRHERRRTRGFGLYTGGRLYDLYSVVIDGVHTEEIIVGQSCLHRHAEWFATGLAAACGVDLACEYIDKTGPVA